MEAQMMVGGGQIDLTSFGDAFGFYDLHRKGTGAIEPGGEAFKKTFGDMLYSENGQGKVGAQAGEELGERFRSTGGAHHTQRAKCFQARAHPASGGWSRTVSSAAPHQSHLTHDGELGAKAFRQHFIVAGGNAAGLLKHREGAFLEGIHGDLKVLAFNAGGDD